MLYLVAKFASMFRALHTAPSIDSGIGLLMSPTLILEMVFAVWIIVKGLIPSAIAYELARQS